MTAPGGGGPGGGAGAGDRDNNSIICILNNATACQSIYVHMIVYWLVIEAGLFYGGPSVNVLVLMFTELRDSVYI